MLLHSLVPSLTSSIISGTAGKGQIRTSSASYIMYKSAISNFTHHILCIEQVTNNCANCQIIYQKRRYWLEVIQYYSFAENKKL